MEPIETGLYEFKQAAPKGKSGSRKSGIPALDDIIHNYSREFVDKLFSNKVTVNEKLDASAFGVEKNLISGQLDFYKRNTEVPISKVDRTLMRYYEGPIAYLSSLDEKTLAKIPANWRFGMEYFISEQPHHITYDTMPKNSLVLSYIHIKDRTGKLIRTVQEKKELDRWADILGVERSPIIFQGVLNDGQKARILDYVDTPKSERVGKFKTTSFVKYMISILNPSLRKTALNNDLDKSIEGIVFRFGDDENVVMTKMLDPMFEIAAKEKSIEKSDDEPSDIYYLTVVDMLNFLSSTKISAGKYKPRGRSYEDRYINFVCAVFNDFVAESDGRYEGVDFAEPSYLKKPEFDVNYELIPDPKTLELVQGSETNKRLFKIMLASFRKKRRKENTVMTKGVIVQFNAMVEKINDHLAHGLKESEVPTFGEFLMQRGRNIMQDEPEDVVMVDLDADNDVIDSLAKTIGDPEGFVAEVDEPESKEDDEEKPKKIVPTKVNIIVGRFQPFHKGHLNMVRELKDANKLPTVMVVVNTGKNNSGKSPFSYNTIKSMIEACASVGKEKLIIDVIHVDSGFIMDVAAALSPNYVPVLWGVGKDRSEDYKKQLHLNFKQGDPIKLGDQLEIMETSRINQGEDVRDAIREDDYAKFKELVPKPVHGMYTILRTELAADDRLQAEKKEKRIKEKEKK